MNERKMYFKKGMEADKRQTMNRRIAKNDVRY